MVNQMSKQATLLITLITLNVADVATTLHGFSIGAAELNPLFSVNLIPLKLLLTVVYAGIFVAAYKFCAAKNVPKGLLALNVNLLVLVGIYTAVIVNNLTILTIIWGI